MASMEESGRERIGKQLTQEREVLRTKEKGKCGKTDSERQQNGSFWNVLEEKAVQGAEKEEAAEKEPCLLPHQRETCGGGLDGQQQNGQSRNEQRQYEQRQRERRLREKQERAAQQERQAAYKRQKRRQLQKALVEKEWEKRLFMRLYLQHCYVEKMILARLEYEDWLRSGSLERRLEELKRIESQEKEINL